MKSLFKVSIACLLCICFACVSDYMPHLGQKIFNTVFETFDGAHLLFVVGVTVCITIILKKWARNIKAYYIFWGIAFAVSSLALFNGHLYLPDELTFGIDGTLMDKANKYSSDLSMNKWIFMEYYFENKNLVISNEEKEKDNKNQYIYKMAVPACNVLVDEQIEVSEEKAQSILSYPFYDDAPYYFVVDKYWEKTKNIRLIESEEKYIFCSEEILFNVYENLQSNILPESKDAFSVLNEIVKSRPYKNIKQIMIMLLLLAIGLVITLSLWGKDYLALAFASGLPIGAALWCICGIVFMIFNIPYNLFSVLGSIILVEGIWIRKRKNYRNINWERFLDFMLMAIVCIVLLVYAKAYFATHDSVVKCAMGYRLAKFGSVRDILSYAAPYGMLELMIMSIGYMIGGDILYSFYPLMALSGILLICIGGYYLNNKEKNWLMLLTLGGGLIFLLTNGVYILSCFYMMAHGPIAVYTLLLSVIIILKKQINIEGVEGIVAITSAMILVTRVEGAIYVLFMLFASLGIENEYLKMKRINIVVTIMIIIWNVAQTMYIGQDTSPLFWTPKRGVLLIMASIGVLAFTLLKDKGFGVLNIVKEKLFMFVIPSISVGCILVSIFFKRNMASINFPVYLAHFSNSVENGTNSAAFWLFVILLSLMILCVKSNTAKYSVTIIWGYILLIYAICLFREGAPLRLGIGDSARRTVVQIMPTAVWLLVVCTGKLEKRLKG